MFPDTVHLPARNVTRLPAALRAAMWASSVASGWREVAAAILRAMGFMRICIMLAGLLCAGTQAIWADTHYVAHNGQSPAGTFLDWTTAASNIQDAIDVTSANDTVLVSNGVYQTGGTVISSLTNRVAITSAITVRSANNDPTNTIIMGAWDPATNGPAAVRCVYMTSGSLIGFTLTNGATLATDTLAIGAGGGLYANTYHTVSNCVITGNAAYQAGGGANYGAFYNCVISANRVIGDAGSYGGSGLYLSYAYNSTIIGNYGRGARDARIYNSSIISNTGAGVYKCVVENSTFIGNKGRGAESCTTNQSNYIKNCSFIGNETSGNGGGAYSCTLYNCLIIGNTTPGYGGGVSESDVYNSTIVGNFAGTAGGGTSWGKMYNSIVYFNATTNGGIYSNCWPGSFYYSCTAPTNGMSASNVEGNPLFINNGSGYGTNNFVAGDYHLSAGSPCINTGTNSSWTTTYPLDLDGRQRIRYGTVDMGAYEFINSGTIFGFH